MKNRIQQIPLTQSHPELVKQWYYLKNKGIDPNQITYGSAKKVWWICALGHSWETKVHARGVSGNGCPYCANQKVLAGYNDLKTNNLLLAKEWDKEANLPLRPQDVLVSSSYRAHWIGLCGHKWQAPVQRRSVRKTGCPYCDGKKVLAGFNDFASRQPDLRKEWDSVKNNLDPQKITEKTRLKAWWICSYNHSWEASVLNRVKGKSGCPYCSGHLVIRGVTDLETLYPEIAKTWDNQKNSLSAQEVKAGSGQKAWWLCVLGHSYEMSPDKRVGQSQGCPYCAGVKVYPGFNDLKSKFPAIAKEWDAAKNAPIKPNSITYGSNFKAYWLCAKNHSYQMTVKGRTRNNGQGYGCSVCANQNFSSKGENELKQFVRTLGVSFEENYRKNKIVGELDIYIPSQNIAIEYNGLYWHSELFKDRKDHYQKYLKCKQEGIYLIQIWEDEWKFKQSIVKSLLSDKLAVSKSISVFARNTKLGLVSKAIGDKFLEQNHLQDYVAGCRYIGLWDKSNNKLIDIAAFKKRNAQEIELVRYATESNVPGGFSEIIKHINEYFPTAKQITTFDDHCISQGNLYLQAGFKEAVGLRPDYAYLVQGKFRVHKFNYRKDRFKSDPNLTYHPNLTEKELAALNNLSRIYDAGKTKYTLDL